jgi:CheY-like chemotaxis protein
MDKVLIVEDDVKLQKFLQIRLQKYKNEFEVLFADNGVEGIRVLEHKHISLLVTDIHMPKLDGMSLLAYINDKYPHIPCIVMTAYPTPELKQKLSDDNIICFFQKPFQFDEFTKAIRQALEEDIPDGSLKGISVASFLQMIQLEQKTCLFEVNSPGEGKGIFYFKEGVPYDALYGDLRGEEAAFKVIAMDKAEIRFKNLPRKKITRRIKTELMGLIMEAIRLKDESEG